MEKLIELLNEYDEYRGEKRRDYGWTKDKVELDVKMVIFKKFGFIKWLVENDKIDLDVLKENMVFTMFTHCVGLGCEWHTVSEGDSVLKTIGTDALIAYISIKDEPIEFLVSILKDD